MSEAGFDRALGAWEDRKLGDYLSQEEAWDNAYDEAEKVVWGLSFNELYEMSPPSVVRDVEAVAERLTAYIAEEMLEGRW